MYSKSLFKITLIFITLSTSIVAYKKSDTIEVDSVPRLKAESTHSSSAKDDGCINYRNIGSITYPVFKVEIPVKN